jgi:D-alanyl-lipoteichoic acid acyltransferase DltB (MBOAT superfamily)
VNNYYVDLYFFGKVIVAVLAFRVAGRHLSHWLRQTFLIVISIYFLSTLSAFPAFRLPLVVYVVAALALGQAITATAGRAKARLLLAACSLAVLVLIAYKYGDHLPGPRPVRDALAHFRGSTWIGLSYLTFKTIDYLVAIRSNSRLTLPAARQGLYGLSYLIFFPAYVSGPIERYQAYVKDQLERWRPMTFFRLRDDCLRIAIGVIKILMLAKWAHANSILTYHFQAGEPASLVVLAEALYFYYLYIYFDFSGYCDVAIAFADLLEVRLPENFNYPFLATSPQDFWNRWHITMAHWLRDIVFFRSLRLIFKRFPRVPELPASMLSIFATFVLMGAWHGDALNWVLYGCYHGAALSAELGYRRAMETICPELYQRILSNHIYKIFCMIVMFNFVALGLLLTLPLESLRHLPIFYGGDL